MDYIKNISIKKFRGIADLEVSNFKQFNVFVGKNDVGKTSILEAVFFLINPNNPQLEIAANSFRGMEVIDYEYWLSYFNNFGDAEVKIESNIFNNHKLLFQMKPHYSDNLGIVKFNDNKVTLDQKLSVNTNLAQTVNGLDISFTHSVNGSSKNKYKAQIIIDTNILPNTNPIRMSQDQNFKPFLNGAFFNNRTFFDTPGLAERFSEASKNKKEGDIVNVLREVESTINDIDLDNKGRLLVDDKRYSRKVILNSYGEGLFRIANIIIGIYSAKNGVVIIDEIENGLHIESQKVLWKAIFKAAIEFNTQLFISTHSMEMIRSFTELAKEQHIEDSISLTRIERNNSQSSANKLDFQKLQFALDEGWEIR